ncbi:MAG TPA: hypothetical protein VKJ01_13910, partial [Candidatus Solibacter sp.]|nr:hypothetical protein [Candidatus Solibacter sp.]
MTRLLALFALLSAAAPAQPPDAADAKPLRVAIAGLAHGHVSGFLRGARNRKEIQIVGVFDPDATLGARYAKDNGFDSGMMFTDLGAMLDRVKPEAVATFTNTYDHATVVEACAS